MRILVTNDDGIDATPMHLLARRLTDVGDVIVAAPDREFSGSGAALGALHLIQPEVHEASIDGVDESWSVTGPPALCVMFARLGVFGAIDLVVSGINPGANVGRAVYHSGTVGAALTARNGGVPAVAVSQQVEGYGVEGQGVEEMMANVRWETAAEVAAHYVAALNPADFTGLEDAFVANINVPDLPLDELRGWRHTEVGTLPPRTLATASLEPKIGHAGAHHVRMNWGEPIPLPVETDGGAVEAGFVSVTHLSRFCHQPHAGLAAADAALDDLLG